MGDPGFPSPGFIYLIDFPRPKYNRTEGVFAHPIYRGQHLLLKLCREDVAFEDAKHATITQLE